jgi:hypothetical protein
MIRKLLGEEIVGSNKGLNQMGKKINKIIWSQFSMVGYKKRSVDQQNFNVST